jgi:hypothetical protein
MAGKTTNGWDFEEIPEDEIQAVRRGRKSTVDPALVDGLRTLTPGRAIRIPSQKLDPKSANYRTEKARVSASLRVAMRAAGHTAFAIIFSPDGVPQIRLK